MNPGRSTNRADGSGTTGGDPAAGDADTEQVKVARAPCASNSMPQR